MSTVGFYENRYFYCPCVRNPTAKEFLSMLNEEAKEEIKEYLKDKENKVLSLFDWLCKNTTFQTIDIKISVKRYGVLDRLDDYILTLDFYRHNDTLPSNPHGIVGEVVISELDLYEFVNFNF